MVEGAGADEATVVDGEETDNLFTKGGVLCLMDKEEALDLVLAVVVAAGEVVVSTTDLEEWALVDVVFVRGADTWSHMALEFRVER